MHKIKKFLELFLLLLGVYFLLRICFVGIYFNVRNIPLAELFKIFYWGFRLDFAVLFFLNLPLWIYLLFIADLVKSDSANRSVMTVLLILINLPFIALNILDLAYFDFNLRRSTVDLLNVFADSTSATTSQLFKYWYLLLLFLVIGVGMFIVTKRILKTFILKDGTAGRKFNWLVSVVILFALALFAKGVNGRFIKPSTPLLYVQSHHLPAAGNSTISFLYSLFEKQTRLEEMHLFSEEKLDSLFDIRRQYEHKQDFSKKNIVLFILESFSRDVLENGSSSKARTPFLDSLINESIVCKTAYANGLESNKGIVALLAGIPPFLNEAFYNSPYNSNPIRGLGTILKEEGYNTNFFMGASPDHFGFGKLCRMLGIDNYYSKNDYGNKRDFDGNWGIYDHNFLPYSAGVLKSKKVPFLAIIFNISSHAPHLVPIGLKSQFNIPGQTDYQNSVSYVDYSIRLFFDSIRNAEWYRNTLFVFAADHGRHWIIDSKAILYKALQIPIFFHIPSHDKQNITKITQQMDVVPTILDICNYSKPFMSFGKSIFDSTPGIAVNMMYGAYQLIDSAFLYGYSGKYEKPAYFYHYKKDSMLNFNLLNDSNYSFQSSEREMQLRSIIQRFNNSLLKHQLFVK